MAASVTNTPGQPVTHTFAPHSFAAQMAAEDIELALRTLGEFWHSRSEADLGDSQKDVAEKTADLYRDERADSDSDEDLTIEPDFDEDSEPDDE